MSLETLAVRTAEPAAAGAMSLEEYGRLLNLLLECERAGAKLIAAYCDELPAESEFHARLSGVQRDEARNCAVLIHLLLEAGIEPTTQVGSFYRKGLGVRSWRERLRFLNRGQHWVADRIAAELPRMARLSGTKALQAMYDSHLANIGLCEEQLG
jgi:nitronate monooxygenase